MERYRKGNFNQGRKFSRYDSQTSLNLKNINNLNANVELEMGLKVEEKRMFYEEERKSIGLGEGISQNANSANTVG